ncbi:MAG: PhoU domain-containing protein [Butyrivibrio hungatei]|nr:PhoU domain-containing protein [Butyrivibrio hungatei]
MISYRELVHERMFETPSIVVSECSSFSVEMCELTGIAVKKAVECLSAHNEELISEIAKAEGSIDMYEDRLGSYLVRLSGKGLSIRENRKVSKMLHTIGNFERISDHALNLTESSKEISEKKIQMSEQALSEIKRLGDAVLEIVEITTKAYIDSDTALAEKVEPLEQVIDLLEKNIRLHHVDRLQSGDCTIERGFVLADILNNYERISDHCSNIAVAVLETDNDFFNPHEYTKNVRSEDNENFRRMFDEYKDKYLSEVNG